MALMDAHQVADLHGMSENERWRAGWRRHRAVTLMAAAVSAIALGLPGGAEAYNFSGANGGTGCNAVNMADNVDHTFFYDTSVSGYMKDAVGWTRGRSYDPTHLNTSTVSTVTSNTDVVVYMNDYSTFCGFSWHPGSSGVVGHVQCVSLTGSRCQKHEMRFDVSFVGPASTDYRRMLACHETGHTLGVMHRNAGAPSCMVQGYPKPQALDAHDIDHLNTAY